MNLANRAASAETAVTQRHLRRLWALPGTQLAVVAWPSTRRDRLFGSWHYWWQAHLLDCLVDAQLRDPQPQRRARINRQVRSHRVRNNFSWLNSYYDDMAWLALALERADRVAGVRRRRALPKLTNQFVEAWVPEDGGGIPWRKQDQFFNAPANGPAGLFLARYPDQYGKRLKRAEQMADWIDRTLIDPETHLVFDGIKAGSLVARSTPTARGGARAGNRAGGAHRSGSQSAALRSRSSLGRGRQRAHGSIGCVTGRRRRDGGLFAGITARYLALVATTLPGDSADDAAARDTARAIVLASAQSAWEYRQTVDGLPVFGAFWDREAELPTAGGEQARSVRGVVHSSAIAERDLSVQLSGWMLMEAAHSAAAVSSLG